MHQHPLNERDPSTTGNNWATTQQLVPGSFPPLGKISRPSLRQRSRALSDEEFGITFKVGCTSDDDQRRRIRMSGMLQDTLLFCLGRSKRGPSELLITARFRCDTFVAWASSEGLATNSEELFVVPMMPRTLFNHRSFQLW
jgi:hypothetical protein